MENIEKKGRGRPRKNEEDKLIGRRISLMKSEWYVIDYFCDKHGIEIADLMELLVNDLEQNNVDENQND